MFDKGIAAATRPISAATDEFLIRFYRQMGLYAVAAALNVTLDPLAAPAREAPREERRKAA